MSTHTHVLQAIKKVFSNPKAPIVGLVVAGLVAMTGGAAFATRSASDHFANAAFAKLGGNSNDILSAIADKVVKKITSKGGTLDSTQQEIVSNLSGLAGKKFGNLDTNKLISDVKGQVVAAGLGKLNGISTDAIVSQVTAALIAQSSAQLAKVDIQALAKGAIANVIKSLNLDKLVKAKIDSIDIQKIVNDAVAKQFGSSSGSSSGLGGLLGLLSHHN